jgi:predicted dehydrogenase
MIKLGIIGLGVAGQRHLEGFRALAHNDVVLTAVATAHPERRANLLLPDSVAMYTDYRELIREAGIDALIIALPHALHKEAMIYAANHGKHVLLEKPIALTMADAERMMRACDENQIKLMVGYVHRFREESLVARQMIVDRKIGTPASILDRFCVPGDDLPEWVWDRAISGGGVVMYSGQNAVDRLRWMLNSDVIEVYARVQTYGARPDCINIENGVATMLTFENGVIASLVMNMPPYDLQYRYWDTEIFGTGGLIHTRTGDYLEYTGPDVSFKQSFQGYNHYARQLHEFFNAILEDRAPSITLEDGAHMLAVSLAMYRSAYVGRSVLVSNTD